MLTHLQLRDLAIVDRLELELGAGLTVLTGETGAGKSILVDALGLVIGARASTTLVRAGARRAEVTATFDAAGCAAAADWLAEHDLDDDGSCIVRRLVNADGGSRAFVNDRPVSVQALGELGRRLVDIHGQHDHQSLLRAADQRRLLDAREAVAPAAAAVREVHARWREIEEALAAGGASPEERERRLDYLRFQLEELRGLDPRDGESESLGDEQRRLGHAVELADLQRGALELLEGESQPSASSLASRALRGVGDMRRFDPAVGAVGDLLESAVIQLGEAAAELRRYGEGLETDPRRLQDVEERVAALHAAARKHGVRIEELTGLLARIEAEVEGLEAGGAREAELLARREALRGEYDAAAARLHDARVSASTELSAAVTAHMQTLGMEGGEFAVDVGRRGAAAPGPDGDDRVEFQVSANRGQPLRPLARVASGGELSRISLAVRVVDTRENDVPTLVFDEVDAGIGGRTADVVGAELRALSGRRQVLCVTHLPQVAAHARHHLQVHKRTRSGATLAAARVLAHDERVAEIARMLGGADITERTLAHAREMLSTQPRRRSPRPDL